MQGEPRGTAEKISPWTVGNFSDSFVRRVHLYVQVILFLPVYFVVAVLDVHRRFSIRFYFRYVVISTKKCHRFTRVSSQPSAQHHSFVFGRSKVRISARRLAILTGFSWFFSVPPGRFRDSTLNYVTTAAFFHIISNSLTNYRIIRRYIVWSTDSVVK
jgi:hypothetical protein